MSRSARQVPEMTAYLRTPRFQRRAPANPPRSSRLMIAKVDERLKDRDMGLELLPAARTLLSERGYDPVLGARPLRRTIQREIEDNLSEKILFGELRAGQIITVDVEGTGPEAQFTFEGVARPGAVPDAPPAVI